MVWGKTSDPDEHKARSEALTAAYQVHDRAGMGGGSRGGAPIWVCTEAWMPRELGALGRQRRTEQKAADGAQ